MSDLVTRLRLAASDLTATMQDFQRIVAAPVLSAQQEATIRVLTDAAAEIERLRAEKATDAWHTGWQEAVRRMQQAERQLAEAVALLWGWR